jgi:hypothetical protein
MPGMPMHKSEAQELSQIVDNDRKHPLKVADNLKRRENPGFVGTPARVVTMGIPRRNAPVP